MDAAVSPGLSQVEMAGALDSTTCILHGLVLLSGKLVASVAWCLAGPHWQLAQATCVLPPVLKHPLALLTRNMALCLGLCLVLACEMHLPSLLYCHPVLCGLKKGVGNQWVC